MKIYKDIYNELAEILEERANAFLNGEPFDKNGKIFTLFKKYRNTPHYKVFVKNWQLAEAIMEKITNRDLIEILISDLKNKDINKQKQVYSLVNRLAKYTTYPLLQLFSRIKSPSLRKIVAIGLKTTVSDMETRLLREIKKGQQKNRIAKILEIIFEISKGEVIIKYIQKEFNSYSPRLKIQILKIFDKLRTPLSADALITILQNEDEIIQKRIIKILASFKTKKVIESLVNFLWKNISLSKYNLCDEICTTLGKFNDELSVKTLIKITKQSPIRHKLTISAIKGLGFSSHQEAVKHLNFLLKSKDENIRRSAYLNLKKQKENTVKKAQRTISTIV